MLTKKPYFIIDKAEPAKVMIKANANYHHKTVLLLLIIRKMFDLCQYNPRHNMDDTLTTRTRHQRVNILVWNECRKVFIVAEALGSQHHHQCHKQFITVYCCLFIFSFEFRMYFVTVIVMLFSWCVMVNMCGFLKCVLYD